MTTSRENEGILLTAMEIIPESLEMPSWVQHLLSEVITIRHISTLLNSLSKYCGKQN